MKYTRTLDFILASAGFAQRGLHEKAAKAMTIAVARPDITAVLASLDAFQAKALQVEQARAAQNQTGKTRSSALAMALQTAAAKKTKKAKPVVKKKKAKAASEDEFENVLTDMVEESEGMDGEGEGDDEVDLDLVDIEDTLDDGVEEMPVATSEEIDLDGESLTEDDLLDTELSEADDAEEEDETDEDEADEADEADEEDEPKAEAKTTATAKGPAPKPKAMVRVNANLAALARLSAASPK